MKMKTLNLILATCFASLAPLHSEPAAIPEPIEMRELSPFLGTWTVTEFVSKVAEWTPQEIRKQGASATTQAILGGRYLVDDGVGSNDGSGHHGVWSWNAEEKAYHYTYFGEAGDCGEFTAHWDATLKIMTVTRPMPNGITMRGKIHFPDPNTKEWHMVATDASGKVYLDMTAKETRKTRKQ